MAENTESGRHPIEVVQIDQDICTRSYGVAPCTATLATGGRKCFNTIGTCQDTGNYDGGVLTLNFITNQTPMPNDGNYYFPFLRSVKIKPGAINPGGGNKSASAFGQRATISANFIDAPHTDRIVDPYVDERLSGAAQESGVGYDPFERSTFWAKWVARNRYYNNRAIRHISGYLKDGQIVDAITRSFFITGLSGPTAGGAVSIKGKDALTLANDDKAKAPRQSTGHLAAAITGGATVATLTPAGIGDLEYPASGWVRISDEVCTFSRVGDTLTLTRGQFNTEADEHDAGDTVQLCLRYDGERPDDIVADLLQNYAGIPTALLDLAGWATEVTDYMPRLYSALITEPTGVKKLLSEMCEQMYFYLWSDERSDLVKLRAVRPAEGETVTPLDGDRHLIEDSMAASDATDQLITQVWVNYALINPARDLDEPSNYAATEVIGDFPEEGDARQRGASIKVINSRWITAANGAAAIDLGEKLLARYSTPPKKMSFDLDAKDRDLWVGDFVSASSRLVVDDVGEERPVNLQIMSASESVTGTVFSYSGQEFVYEVPPDPDDRLIIISADLVNVNLRELHDSLYPPPTGTETVRVIVRSGVTIGGLIPDQYRLYTGSVNGVPNVPLLGIMTDEDALGAPVIAPTFYPDTIGPQPSGTPYYIQDTWLHPVPVSLQTGNWPTGVQLFLDIEAGASILGAGGLGGCGSHIVQDQPFTSIASNGGHAMVATYSVAVNNLGIIGGGGGGGATSFLRRSGSQAACLGYGGGGAGYASATRPLFLFNTSPGTTVQGIATASAGGDFFGGAAGVFSYTTVNTIFAYSGAGGNLAQEGGAARNVNQSNLNEFPYLKNAFCCGYPGKAVKSGGSNITWVNMGDVRGDIVA